MAKKTVSKRRPKPASKATRPDRRERILQAATELFLAKGVMETQMKEVARAADVDQSLIGYYFLSIDSLFAEVVQSRIQVFNSYVLDAVSERGKDVSGALETYVMRFFEWIRDNPDEARLIQYFFYLSMLREPFIATNASFRRMARERLSGYVFQGIAQKHFSLRGDQVDGERIALQIQSVILGGVQVCLSERGLDPMAHGRDAWETIRKIVGNFDS